MLQAQQPSSLPLSSSDLVVLKSWIFRTAIDWLIHGFNATLALTIFFAILSQQTYRSGPQLMLLALVVVMLILATTIATLDVLFILLEIPLNGYNVVNVANIIQQATDINIASGMVSRLNYVIGDGIVVWRAWVMFPRNLVARGVLVICFMGSLGGALADGGLGAVRLLHDLSDLGAKNNVLIMALPLLIPNIAATGLIGYKARAQKILILLFESGMFYCGVWIVYIVINLSNETSSIAFQTTSATLPGLATLYPILIILMVVLERSREEIRSRNDMSLSQSIRFAPVQTAASQTESQVERQAEVMSQTVGIPYHDSSKCNLYPDTLCSVSYARYSEVSPPLVFVGEVILQLYPFFVCGKSASFFFFFLIPDILPTALRFLLASLISTESPTTNTLSPNTNPNPCTNTLTFRLAHAHALTNESGTIFRDFKGNGSGNDGGGARNRSRGSFSFHGEDDIDDFDPSSFWSPETIPAPNVSDRYTLLTLAKMMQNAYFSPPTSGGSSSDWYDLGPEWNPNSTFSYGWEPDDDGFRGHVFVSSTNITSPGPDGQTYPSSPELVVLTIKGTSIR
ncbi:hypothetical protein D9758_013773 [Tetrapyrgos nigripes]|uniref:Uncharacterized protein n=1 Tax=Tetrapyrgos nigripes TaxID=182062 RepID=A0A8H5D5J2_9AGAR|nr:hypothetical protein D9758_013773 [Tetrapyrgos nigripes]